MTQATQSTSYPNDRKPEPKMSRVRVWVDFMKIDTRGRLLLTTLGTLEDLRKHRVELTEGLSLSVYSDDADDQGRGT
jgi:hypothetical protein